MRSVVGRFLEHSRVYCFANGGDEEIYIGSADLMERNLDPRVEALCRIRDRGLHRHIRDVVLEAYLRDDRAYVMTGGKYVLPSPTDSPRRNAQHFLLDWYTDTSRNDLTMFS